MKRLLNSLRSIDLPFISRKTNLSSKDPELYSIVQQILSQIPVDFGGGCSPDKAFEMAQLIKSNRLKKTLDLGIYRGRSFFPQAVAHKLYTGGVVYGVDPYSNVEAIQNDNPQLKKELDHFARTVDFEKIYQEVLKFRSSHAFEDNSTILRMRSDQAAIIFKDSSAQFDLIHIDGNHDTEPVLQDVSLFEPLLASGGYLVMDDVSWQSVKPALDYLFNLPHIVHIATRVNLPNDDYMIFQKK